MGSEGGVRAHRRGGDFGGGVWGSYEWRGEERGGCAIFLPRTSISRLRRLHDALPPPTRYIHTCMSKTISIEKSGMGIHWRKHHRLSKFPKGRIDDHPRNLATISTRRQYRNNHDHNSIIPPANLRILRHGNRLPRPPLPGLLHETLRCHLFGGHVRRVIHTLGEFDERRALSDFGSFGWMVECYHVSRWIGDVVFGSVFVGQAWCFGGVVVGWLVGLFG
mmetsp:Transcript_33800/g.71063  ORF Transcript_33800/g.71063 Transcript_33800/m.71063 type:complete len:220 (-) Transcript_33800:129-788(-)